MKSKEKNKTSKTKELSAKEKEELNKKERIKTTPIMASKTASAFVMMISDAFGQKIRISPIAMVVSAPSR